MRRAWIWGGLIAVVAIMLYAYSVSLFAASLTPESAPIPVRVPPNGVLITLIPESINPETNELAVLAQIEFDDHFVDAGFDVMQRDVSLRFSPALSGSLLVARKGAPTPEPQRLIIPIVGEVQRYPFDDYAVSLTVTGNGDGLGLIEGGFVDDRRLAGWALQIDPPEQVEEGGYLAQQMRITRAGSTITVSLLILSLMVVLAILAVAAVVSIHARRRRVLLSSAGWFTALIFALTPLRSFLPGGPPIGSWIDILVFFWVEVTLMIVLSVHVGIWIGRSSVDD